MRFERGKDIKESMSIGLIGNPIVLTGVFTSNYLPPSPDATTGSVMSHMNDKDIRRILGGIESGEITFWEDTYTVGVLGKKSDQLWVSPIKYQMLEDLKGKYVMHNSIKYLIPE